MEGGAKGKADGVLDRQYRLFRIHHKQLVNVIRSGEAGQVPCPEMHAGEHLIIIIKLSMSQGSIIPLQIDCPGLDRIHFTSQLPMQSGMD